MGSSESQLYMSKGNVVSNPEAVSGYNPWAFEPMLHQEFNVLKARLLNLADSIARDDKQANSIKGLIRDFVNKAYYESYRQIKDYARYFEIIGEGEDQNNSMHLEAESLADLQA